MQLDGGRDRRTERHKARHPPSRRFAESGGVRRPRPAAMRAAESSTKTGDRGARKEVSRVGGRQDLSVAIEVFRGGREGMGSGAGGGALSAFFAKVPAGGEPAVQPAIQARRQGRREMTYAAAAKTSGSIYERGALTPKGGNEHAPPRRQDQALPARLPHRSVISSLSCSGVWRPVRIRQRSTTSRRAAATTVRLRARFPRAARTGRSGG